MDKRSETKRAYERATTYAKTFLDDLRDSELPTTLRRDLKDTYQFYLDDETREELARMGTFKRGLYSSWYLIRSLFLKLAPTRRLLLLLGVVVTLMGTPNDTGEIVFGMLCILFVLGLELKDKLRARDELEEGRAVQIALMPSDNPSFPGWETWLHTTPANDVGGDLVDHLRIDDKRLALTLGDVAGKGLPAALMMAKLQATIRALAPISDSLSELGEQLNAIVCRDGLPSKFASLVHLEIRDEPGVVHLLNAGHLPPLIIRKEGIDRLPRGSAAIGLMRDAKFEEQTAHLDLNDIMVIYSDGLTEARNEIGRFFGEDRLRDLLRPLRSLSASQAGNRILGAVKSFKQGVQASDDLSIILLKRVA
ncbi:MAG: SpoIIE family protein phosphatase [Bacteroidetes bacterium]|nr:SpoIIE family protein phosphatase [Bacteroidota bacterium]